MHPIISDHLDDIRRVCEEFDLGWLSVTGSAARGTDFDPERSDVDFLLEYGDIYDPHWPNTLTRRIGLRDRLANLLDREVELIFPYNVRNPQVLESMMEDAVPLYAADKEPPCL